MSSVAEPSSSAASGSPSKERVEVMSKAVNLMGQGKRNLICGDVPMAVTQFEESCQILAKCYGEMAFECAAAYFSYGHALLELARLDSKVIESLEAEAAAAEAEEDDDDDDDDDEEEGDDGENEKSEKDSDKYKRVCICMFLTEKDDGASSKAASKEDEGTGDEDRTDNSESLSSQDEAVENQEKPEEKDPEEDEHNIAFSRWIYWPFSDEVSKSLNTSESFVLQSINGHTRNEMCWMGFTEIAYLRKDKESQLKAAQAYLKLGEVGLETGLYDLAAEDIKECLKIQKEHLNPEEREIAETYPYLYTNTPDFEMPDFRLVGHWWDLHKWKENPLNCCIYDYKNDINALIFVFADKLNKSKEHLKDSTETTDVETVYNARTEIKELEEIVPDITQKITDTIEEKKTVADLKAFAKKEAAEKMVTMFVILV
ncbi:protein HGV2 [Octopus bimaculoides]|uniref:protein HGV2 n=1 Tax=Octopus bimaculoides TaxID=37653 RepID=UPI0022E4181D|nr:protein HGV2 [Octopus bimaculoides]